MHHIERLYDLMKRAENKLLPGVLSSSSQSKLSDHSSASDPHANFEHPNSKHVLTNRQAKRI